MNIETFARYFLSGCVALAVHLSVLAALVELFSFDEVAASGIGFVFACIVNYCIQYFYVFRVSDRLATRALRYVVITVFTLLLNMVVFYLIIQFSGLHYALAQGLTTGFIFVVNFVLNSLWTFNIQADDRGTHRRLDGGVKDAS
ncbi:MAG: GtrA family protein [Pseudomonadota bacterium]